MYNKQIESGTKKYYLQSIIKKLLAEHFYPLKITKILELLIKLIKKL